MVNKLTVNDDHYETKLAKMAFIWGRTDRLAQSSLKPRFTLIDSDWFCTSQEILKALYKYFHNPYKAREALHKYNHIMIKPKDLFLDFRS